MAAQLAQALAGNLRDVGVDTELVGSDWPSFLASISVPEDKGTAHMHLFNWAPALLDASQQMTQFVRSQWPPQGLATSHYWNPKVELLVGQAARERDDQKRLDQYAEAQRIVWDDAPWIFLWVAEFCHRPLGAAQGHHQLCPRRNSRPPTPSPSSCTPSRRRRGYWVSMTRVSLKVVPVVEVAVNTGSLQSVNLCKMPRHFWGPFPPSYTLKHASVTMLAWFDGLGGAATGTSNKHTFRWWRGHVRRVGPASLNARRRDCRIDAAIARADRQLNRRRECAGHT